MKKALALVLALVFAFSLSTLAFADDEPADVLAAVDSVADAAEKAEDAVFNIVDVAEGIVGDTNIFKTIENAAVSVVEAIASFDFTAFNSDVIAETIDGFRDALENVGISTSSGTIKELFTDLKQKIKDLYCGDVATTVIVETEPEDVPETGSSATTGIAVFAAVSVAAAAAFVCTKKKVA